MFVPKKVRYAIRSYVDLAVIYTQTHKSVTTKVIAKRQRISFQFLSNIFHVLMRKGLLKSTAGRSGGYVPGKPLEKITVLSLIEIFNRPFYSIECLDPSEGCALSKNCPATDFWHRASKQVNSIFGRTTISSLVHEHLKKQQ